MGNQVEICASLGGEAGVGDREREDELARAANELECDDKDISRTLSQAGAKYQRQPAMLQEIAGSLSIAKSEYGVEYGLAA